MLDDNYEKDTAALVAVSFKMVSEEVYIIDLNS